MAEDGLGLLWFFWHGFHGLRGFGFLEGSKNGKGEDTEIRGGQKAEDGKWRSQKYENIGALPATLHRQVSEKQLHLTRLLPWQPR